MKFSTLASQRDNKPTRGECTFDELAEALADVRAAECDTGTCRRSECPHKAGLSWSPAFWRPGATRGLAGLEGVSCLVVDVDHASDVALVGIFASVGSNHNSVVCASHSDRPGDRCVRVVVELDRDVLPAEFPRFWRTACAALGLTGDRQTKDASRLYYCPSRPRDACDRVLDGSGYAYWRGHGPPMNVDVVLALTDPAPEPDVAPRTETRERETSSGELTYDQVQQAIQVLADAWPQKERHSAHLALAGALAHAGWEAEDIADFAAAVADKQQPGNGDLHKRLATARTTVSKVVADVAVTGWPTLEEHVGEEAVERATALLGIGVVDCPEMVGWVKKWAQKTKMKADAKEAAERSASVAFEPTAAERAEARRTLAHARAVGARRRG